MVPKQLLTLSPSPSAIQTHCSILNNASSSREIGTLAVLGELQLRPSVGQDHQPLITKQQVIAWLESVTGLVRDADVVLTNFPTLIQKSEPDNAQQVLGGLSSLMSQLVVSLANTGISQKVTDDEAAVTTRALEGSGIHWLGVNAKKRHMVILRGGGETSRVGLLAFCGAYKDCGKGNGLPFSPLKYSMKAAKTIIQEMKAHGVRMILVLMHWGSETSYYTEETALTIARQLATLGVSAILGNRPNAVHDHAYFGNTLVLFSLGKLLSSTRVSNYCWNKLSGEWTFSLTKACSMIHPNAREELLHKELSTRIYKLHLAQDSFVSAEYMTIPLLDFDTGKGYSIRRPAPIGETSNMWTHVCSDSDRHCLACKQF